MTDLAQYALSLGERAQVAAKGLQQATGCQKNAWLRRSAELLVDRTPEILGANTLDVDQAPSFGLTPAATDRLRLTTQRIAEMAAALRQIAELPDPVGEVIEGSVRPNGLLVTRVRVPLGVVFFIFESRPNVTADAAAICVKSGNAVILRGGKEALHSNRALHRVLVETLTETGLPPDAIQLVETTNRDVVGHLLKMADKIDVTIPRGGKSLISRVAAEAKMPVIKHFDGVCHVYVDRSADLQMAEEILINSKCQRPGVCNAAESLLVHEEIAGSFLPGVAERLRAASVELRGDPRTLELVPFANLASDEDYRTEYLDLILSVRVVEDVDMAIRHINDYGSHHSDTIVTSDLTAARRFTTEVDSAAVLVNASTRFNDGGELGLGAEIGISTDRFHARGPCGIRELTTYKYVICGSGQIR